MFLKLGTEHTPFDTACFCIVDGAGQSTSEGKKLPLIGLQFVALLRSATGNRELDAVILREA